MLLSLFQRIFHANNRRYRATTRTKGFARQLHIECLEERRVLSSTNVVFLFDETASTASFQEDWLTDIVSQVDSSLSLAGISDRQYGLVGFGDNESLEHGHSHVVDPSGTDILFGSANQLTSAAVTLGSELQKEDGWDAIEHAVAEYNFDPGAAVLFVLIQNQEGHVVKNRTLTEPGILAAMESHNITLTTVVEASFDDDMYSTGGVVYGVEADENDNSDDNRHIAYVDNPVANNGLPAEVFSDTDMGGPHIIGGSTLSEVPQFPSDTDNDYVRLGWKTGGSAWNIDVVREGQNATPGSAAADQLAEFNSSFVDSLTDQALRKLAAVDVAFADDPLLEINVGGPAIGNFIAASSIPGFLPSNGSDESASGTISMTGNSVAPGIPIEVFETVYAKPIAETSPDNLEFSISDELVPNGDYVVELLFAEILASNPDFFLSFFDVEIEGEKLLDTYQLFNDKAKIGAANAEQELSVSSLGSNTAVAKRFRVNVDDGNGLQIVLQTASGFEGPVAVSLNGLRILKTPDSPPTITDIKLDRRDTVGSLPDWHDDAEISFADRVLAGTQFHSIGTKGANTIDIVFSESVTFDNNGLELTLIGTGGTSVGSPTFNLDPGGTVATWTFSSDLPDDKYAIHLDTTTITNAAGNELDGDWTNDDNGTPDDVTDDVGRPFDVGDGQPGSANDEFRFHFAYLPGDYDGAHIVDAADETVLIDSLGSTTDLAADGNGSGTVSVNPEPNYSVSDHAVWAAAFGFELSLQRSEADYADDEIVDQGDYDLWKATFSSTTDLRADGNDDGVVDAIDYAFWRDQLDLNRMSAWYVDPAGGTGGPPPISAPIVLFNAAPQVMNVTISGSTSTHDPFDMDTVDGSGTQLLTVPVGGADTVSITFSEDVYVAEGDLLLRGLSTGAIPNVAEFTYDMMTATATWRYDDLVANDIFVISLDDAVHDVEGDLLDGEWVNPYSTSTTSSLVSEFPSGNGAAGGDFNFAFTLLAGDLDGNNQVNLTDIVLFSPNFGVLTNATFNIGDMDGDGDVDLDDFFLLNPNGDLDLQALSALFDLNGDNQVDQSDFDIFSTNWADYDAGTLLNPTASDGDFDGDGDIDASDDALRIAFGLLDLGWVA